VRKIPIKLKIGHGQIKLNSIWFVLRNKSGGPAKVF